MLKLSVFAAADGSAWDFLWLLNRLCSEERRGWNRVLAYLEHVGDGLEASVWVVGEPSRSRNCNTCWTRRDQFNRNGARGTQPILAKPNRKLTGELVEDEERVEVSQLKPARIPDQQTKQRNGWPSKSGKAHLPMLRRTTAPTPSYCGRARNLRTTCRGFSMDANLCSKLLVLDRLSPTSTPAADLCRCAQVRRRRLCQLALPLPLQASRYIAARACRFSSKATARSLADLSSFSLPRSLGKAYIKPTPWAHLPKSLCWTAAAGGHADAMPTQAFLRCPAPCVGRPIDNQ
jgi:hypothetical protein